MGKDKKQVVAVVGSRSMAHCPALLARLDALQAAGELDQVVSGGAAGVDSKRRAGSARTRDSTGEGRLAGDVRSVHVWRSRFAGAGMCSAGEALRGRGAEARANARNKEDEGRIVAGVPCRMEGSLSERP